MAAEIIPNPDPSSMTERAIDRSVSNSEAVIGARLDGMEKAVGVFQADLTRVPTSVDRAILGLRELLQTRLDCIDHDLVGMHGNLDKRERDIDAAIQHLRDLVFGEIEKLAAVTNERFAGVGSQFAERDTRTDQRAGDTKLAVDAAFAAAKESTGEIKNNFTKSIDGQQTLIAANTKATDDKIGDLKDRLTAMESRTQTLVAAKAEGRDNQNDNRGFIFGVVGMVTGIGGLALVVLTHVVK